MYKILADGLSKDFGAAFKETMRTWCKKVDDGKYWQVWIVKDDNKKTVGVCGIYSMDFKTNELWLGWLGILPQHRNKGLGKEIMKHLYSHARLLGCKRIYSYVDKKGKPLSFYYREGFKRVGTVKEFLSKKKNIEQDNFENLKDHIIVKKI